MSATASANTSAAGDDDTSEQPTTALAAAAAAGNKTSSLEKRMGKWKTAVKVVSALGKWRHGTASSSHESSSSTKSSLSPVVVVAAPDDTRPKRSSGDHTNSVKHKVSQHQQVNRNNHMGNNKLSIISEKQHAAKEHEAGID